MSENFNTYDFHMTLEEIGKHFGVSKERIRETEAKALHKLRHPCRAKYLKRFLGWSFGQEVLDKSLYGRVKKKKTLQEIEEYVPNYWPKVF